MDIKAMIWHFATHFSLAFTMTILVILGFNGFSNGEFNVNNWLWPFGIGLLMGVVTTVMEARK